MWVGSYALEAECEEGAGQVTSQELRCAEVQHCYEGCRAQECCRGFGLVQVNKKYNTKVEGIDSDRKAKKVFKERKALLTDIVKKVAKLASKQQEDDKEEVRCSQLQEDTEENDFPTTLNKWIFRKLRECHKIKD